MNDWSKNTRQDGGEQEPTETETPTEREDPVVRMTRLRILCFQTGLISLAIRTRNACSAPPLLHERNERNERNERTQEKLKGNSHYITRLFVCICITIPFPSYSFPIPIPFIPLQSTTATLFLKRLCVGLLLYHRNTPSLSCSTSEGNI